MQKKNCCHLSILTAVKQNDTCTSDLAVNLTSYNGAITFALIFQNVHLRSLFICAQKSTLFALSLSGTTVHLRACFCTSSLAIAAGILL